MHAFLSRSLLSGLASLTFAAPASADVTVDFLETGAGVFGSFSGSLSLSGLTLRPDTSPSNRPAFVDPSSGEFRSRSFVQSARYTGLFTPAACGSGGLGSPSITAGDSFALVLDPANFGASAAIFVPLGYVPGGALTGTMDFNGATLASLGMTPGSYMTTLPEGESITVNITAVPEPGAYALMLAGLGVLGTVVRRRQRQAAAAA